ncbi:mitochondrial carrier [Ramicandelaber brevisporus]|nr:mitochondrial carrier [Ramicandelaber brevisporus]
MATTDDRDRDEPGQSHVKRSIPSQSAGVVRALIMQPLYFWYRVPLKLFRPVRVDYLAPSRAVLMSSSEVMADGAIARRMPMFLRQTSLGLLIGSVKLRGWGFIPRYVLLPLIGNSTVGIALFTAYDHSYRYLRQSPLSLSSSSVFSSSQFGLDIDAFAAGAIGGLAHSVFGVPFDNVFAQIEAREVVSQNARYGHSWGYFRDAWRSLSWRQLYSSLRLSIAKDAVGFAAFFGVFESAKRVLAPARAGFGHLQRKSKETQSYVKESLGVLGSGALAAMAFQVVHHPFTRYGQVLNEELVRHSSYAQTARTHHQQTRPLSESGKYTHAWRVLRVTARSNGMSTLQYLWAGSLSTTLRSVPASALGLLCYELLRHQVDDH